MAKGHPTMNGNNVQFDDSAKRGDHEDAVQGVKHSISESDVKMSPKDHVESSRTMTRKKPDGSYETKVNTSETSGDKVHDALSKGGWSKDESEEDGEKDSPSYSHSDHPDTSVTVRSGGASRAKSCTVCTGSEEEETDDNAGDEES